MSGVIKAALHPQIETVLKAMADAKLRRFEEMTPVQARAQFDAVARANKAARAPVNSITDRSFQGSESNIGVRIYCPHAPAPLPAIVYFHGGGHVVGSLDSHDLTARNLCSGAEAVVISVDYRLAPEHKFPAAVIDAFDALLWVVEHAEELGVDAERIGVAGDSAGANLAAVISIMARDAGSPRICLQSLVYPVIDYGMQDESYQRYAEGFGILTKSAMEWFRNHYLRTPADAEDWRASPIKAANLAGVAPAIIIAAECDVVRDEGERYAGALRRAGVPVERHEYPGMIHGFFGMPLAVDTAPIAQREVQTAFRRAFSRPATPNEAGGRQNTTREGADIVSSSS
jgi:acetyl esterase